MSFSDGKFLVVADWLYQRRWFFGRRHFPAADHIGTDCPVDLGTQSTISFWDVNIENGGRPEYLISANIRIDGCGNCSCCS